MANRAHLEVLLRGVEAWNRWRREHPEQKPDLSEADLRVLDLRNADLHRADLREADMRAVNLEGADLREARLDGADLRHLWGDTASLPHPPVDAFLSDAFFFDAVFDGSDEIRFASLRNANLSRAKLYGANLSGADLEGCDLSGAELIHVHLGGANLAKANLAGADISVATLTEADLAGARFDGAVISNAVFADNDLTAVHGLDAMIHRGPSLIGINTMLRSQTDEARAFFRAAGVAQSTVEHFATSGAKQFHSCFISYSTRDRRFAERLYADLQRIGVPCWYAPEDLKIGTKLRVGIDESIRAQDKLLLILSKHSVASQWVEKEVETALEREQRQNETILYPIRLDDTVMQIDSGWPADIRRTRNIGDFRRWRTEAGYAKALERLVRDLTA